MWSAAESSGVRWVGARLCLEKWEYRGKPAECQLCRIKWLPARVDVDKVDGCDIQALVIKRCLGSVRSVRTGRAACNLPGRCKNLENSTWVSHLSSPGIHLPGSYAH